MEYVDENETIVEPDDDGGWVSTHNTETTTNSQTNTTQDDKTSEIQLDSDKVIYSTCTHFKLFFYCMWISTQHFLQLLMIILHYYTLLVCLHCVADRTLFASLKVYRIGILIIYGTQWRRQAFQTGGGGTSFDGR